MKRFRVLLIVISLFITHFSYTQDFFVVMSTNASNGITYQQSSDASMRVFPGMQLATSGSLLLESGKTISLVYNGQKIDINGPRQVALNDLTSTPTTEENSFLGRFWNFVSSSVSKTESPQEVETYHQKYMTNTVAGIRGFGDKAYAISVPIQFTETLSGDFLPLYWTNDTIQAYTVEITAETDQNLVLKMLTNTNQVQLALHALALNKDQVYNLKISATHNDELNSGSIRFSYEPEMVNNYLEELKTEKEYQELNAEEQLLYLCWELENERYFNAAYEHYQQLLASSPGNAFYQNVFAAFLARMNDLTTAKALIER